MDIMEIKELVSFSINESSQTMSVAFRLIEDSDDEIREDQIEIDEIKKFGYDFLDSSTQKFKDLFGEGETYDEFDEFEEYDDEFLEDSIDEHEVISFLTEYYMVNERKLPDSEMF
jgi:hypothetical protein